MRQDTFKTPLSVIKRRWYLTWWIVVGLPILWLLRPEDIGVQVGPSIQTRGSYWFQFCVVWVSCWVALHGFTWFMTIGMYFWGALVNSGPAYQQWLQAGGHPFWDTLYFFNTDAPQVRAAIGIPPAQPICFNCGASLTGLAGLGSNYGNVCPNCGVCNDTFAQGDTRPGSFLG